MHIPILSTLCKTLVEIGTDDALVELGASNIFHAIERVLVSVVFDEAEAARRLLEAIKTHNQALDLTALGEKLVNLFLGCVE